MFFHYLTASDFGADSSLTRKIIGVAGNMWSGVDLFFVLSGFLITGILLRAKDKPGYFKNFYMRRVLRIFPLYYAELAVIFWVVPLFHPTYTHDVQRIYDTQGWLWAYSENIAIGLNADDYFDVDWLWVGHLWSLAVEEHFYLVWPMLVFFCSRRGLLYTCLGLLFVTPIIRTLMTANHTYYATTFTLTFCRTDELAFGGLVALTLGEPGGYERLRRYSKWGFAIAGAYLLGALLIHRRPLDYRHWSMLCVGFSALATFYSSVLITALAPERTAFKRVLESRFLTGFGKYSYGAYIFHTPMQPVYLMLFPPRKIAFASRGLGDALSQVVGLLGFGVIGIACTMLFAVMSYHAFEKHFLKLKRFFEYGTSGRVAVAPEG
jgi:peptidoglycan/LPS O-acetylase OafA/YrhL